MERFSAAAAFNHPKILPSKAATTTHTQPFSQILGRYSHISASYNSVWHVLPFPPTHTHTTESLMQLGTQEPGKSKSHFNRPHYDVVPLREGSSPNPGTGVPEVTGFLIKLCWAATVDRFLSGGPPGAEWEARPGKVGPEAGGGRPTATLTGLAVTEGALGMTWRCRSSETRNIGGFVQKKMVTGGEKKGKRYILYLFPGGRRYLVLVLWAYGAQQTGTRAPDVKSNSRVRSWSHCKMWGASVTV